MIPLNKINSAFSLLYKIFYDKTLFDTYVDKGKGNGVKVLLVLAVFVSLLLSLNMLQVFSKEIPALANIFSQDLPEIVFENGKIVSPKNIVYKHLSSDKTFFFVLDTKNNHQKLNQLPLNGIYLSSDRLYIHNLNDVRRIDLPELLKKKSFVVHQENANVFIDKTSKTFKYYIMPLFFIISIPTLLCAYFLVSFGYACISYVITMSIKVKLSFEERMRLAGLSIMPVYIINAIATLLGSHIQLGLLGILITFVYMFGFVKDAEALKKYQI